MLVRIAREIKKSIPVSITYLSKCVPLRLNFHFQIPPRLAVPHYKGEGDYAHFTPQLCACIYKFSWNLYV